MKFAIHLDYSTTKHPVITGGTKPNFMRFAILWVQSELIRRHVIAGGTKPMHWRGGRVS